MWLEIQDGFVNSETGVKAVIRNNGTGYVFNVANEDLVMTPVPVRSDALSELADLVNGLNVAEYL